MDLFARPWMFLVALPAGLALYWAEKTLRKGRASGRPAARYARVAMRSGLVILLAFAAAGLRLGGKAVRPACVFALDCSRSMGDPAPAEDAYFRARQSLPAGTPRAACAFAGAARAFLGFSDIEDAAAGLGLEEMAARLGGSRTNVAGGLRSALGLLPSGTAGALVLVSDGRETEGRAIEAALECRARGVPVFALIPGPAGRADLRVESFTAPAVVEAGRPVPLVAAVSSSVGTRAEVVARRLPGGGELGRVAVALRADAPAFVRFSDTPRGPGVARYEVEVRRPDETVADGWPGNDRAEAAVTVRGTPRVLVVTKGGGLEELLRRAEEGGDKRFEVEPRGPSALPASADVLAGYAAVMLEGLARGDVSAAQEAALVGYLNRGGGLLVTGGREAFGAGEWRDTDELAQALPVKMTPGPLKRTLVVLIVDASGSMKMEAGSSRSGGGRTKMELAREAVAAVLPELGGEDEVALVAFRDRAELILGPVSAAMRDDVLDSVRDLTADGPTSLVAPLEKGLEVVNASAAEKRVAILFSDGEPTVEFSRERLFELARGFRGEDTSLHVLGTNPSPEHRELLDRIAAEAGGIVEHESDYKKVKQALRELFRRATNRYLREGPVAVSPGGALPALLDGLGEFPALGSLNRTQIKPGARLVLVAGTGEPVLALGPPYGVAGGAGRVGVFTSTLGGPWAGGFGSWEKRLRFVSQLLREIMPPPADEGIAVRAVRERGGVFVEVEARDEDGRSRNLLELAVAARARRPESMIHSPARQVALGRYRAPLPAEIADPVRALHVEVKEGRRGGRILLSTHLVMPPPPELLRTGPDRAALDEIARASGGRVLGSPGEIARALDELRSRERREASWLLALAALALVIAELVARLLARRSTSSRPASPEPPPRRASVEVHPPGRGLARGGRPDGGAGRNG